MNKKGLDELKELLISGVEFIVQGEAEKLRQAAGKKEGHAAAYVTRDENDGGVELLVAAGLFRRAGEEGGIYDKEFFYKLTEKGRRMYELIYENKKD